MVFMKFYQKKIDFLIKNVLEMKKLTKIQKLFEMNDRLDESKIRIGHNMTRELSIFLELQSKNPFSDSEMFELELSEFLKLDDKKRKDYIKWLVDLEDANWNSEKVSSNYSWRTF